LGYCEELSKLLEQASDRLYDLSFDVSVATSEEDVDKVLRELLDTFERLVFLSGMCAHEVMERRVEEARLMRLYRKMLKERAKKAKVQAEAKIKEKVAIQEFEPRIEFWTPALGEFIKKVEEEEGKK
jgi:serine phosphatase RsbU (regulator of sigma subunit)